VVLGFGLFGFVFWFLVCFIVFLVVPPWVSVVGLGFECRYRICLTGSLQFGFLLSRAWEKTRIDRKLCLLHI
jgi:hypothetical protein